MRHLLTLMAVALTWLVGISPASGQATQEAAVTRDWLTTSQEFATAVIDQDLYEASLRATPDVQIRRFHSADNVPLGRLVNVVNAGQLLSCRAYVGVPVTLASDLQEDLASNEALPEEVQARFRLRDTAAADRANEVASRWVQGVIRIGQEDALSVAVVWAEDPALPTMGEQAYQRQLIFILMRANEPKTLIADIAFGFPAGSSN